MSEFKMSGETTTSTSGQTTNYGTKHKGQRPVKIIPKPKFLMAQANIGFAEVAEGMANQKYIFGGLISEGDLTILFSQQNLGKSFLAWQIAEATASGKDVFSVMDNTPVLHHGETKYYNLNNTSEPQKVLLFDFESTREKNKGRYTYNNNEFPFNENLIILYPDYDGEESDFSNSEAIITVIGEKIRETNAKFIIIDNITSLSEDNADGKKALILMKRLKWLQMKNKITMLVIAHTTKIIPGQPVKWQDMAGSYIMAGLIDNQFALNNSTDDKGNYLIQLKAKYSEKHFENDNVIAMRKTTRPDGLTAFEFIDYAKESALLKPVDELKNEQEKEEIIRLFTASKAIDENIISLREIAKKLHTKYGKDVSFLTYYNRLKKRKERGDYNIDDTLAPNVIPPAVVTPKVIAPATITHETLPPVVTPIVVKTHSNPNVQAILNDQKSRENAENAEALSEIQADLNKIKNKNNTKA
jgi:AAA domain